MVDVETMRDRVTDFGDAMNAVLDELADLRHEAERLRARNVDLADELVRRRMQYESYRKRLMPEGMEWPRYDTGELVEIGDEVASSDDDGSPMTVNSVKLSGSMFKLLDCYNCEITDGWTDSDERVRRPEPPATPSQECRDTVALDSWERWREDVALVACDYCDERGIDYGNDSDAEAKTVEDLERRAKALVGEVE